MAIPRRFLIIAASALATGALLYARNKIRERNEKSSKRSDPKDPAPKHEPSPSSTSSKSSTAPSPSPSDEAGQTGSMRELALFLAGESWYDEVGWQGIWEREAIESPEGWLRTVGKDVLVKERGKLASHPALLAGCRRRWIVVCRYAGIDVADSAALWNSTEA